VNENGETNPIEGVENEEGGRDFRLSDGRDGPPIPAMAEHPPEIQAQIRRQEAAVAARASGATPPPGPGGPVPPSDFIFTTTEYADNFGRLVAEREVVKGEAPGNFSRYVSRHTVNIPPHLAAFFQGAAKAPYRFPIEGATTLDEAFEKWEECARKYGEIHARQLEDQVRQAQEPGIVVPPPGAKLPDPPPGQSRIELP